MKLSPTDKQFKRDMLELQHTRNRALVSWATKKIGTLEDLLVSVGHDKGTLRAYYHDQAALDKPLDRPAIMQFFDAYRIQLEHTRDGIGVDYNYQRIPHEYEGYNSSATPPPVTVLDVVPAPLADPFGDTLNEHETLPPSAKQKCSLFAFQERAAAALLFGIVNENKRGQMLRAAVGTGKTFVIGALARRLLDMKFCVGKTFSPWPIVYITKASIVEQTERVLREQFGICTSTEVKVINIEQLRASFGELMVRSETIVERGEEHIKWVWRAGVHPLIVLWDECQILKNTDSQQSKIAQAFNDIMVPETYQIFFSATPFMRVCEAKCFAVATRLRTKYSVVNTAPLSNESWNDYADHTAAPADPEEYSPASCERLMESLNRYIVDVKGVRAQFSATNSTMLIAFRTVEEKKFYEAAWERYERMRQKIAGYDLSSGQSQFLILAQFTIFRKAAELCRAEYLADAMYEAVQAGEAACLAVNFKGTIRRVVTILSEKHGVSRDDISLIWGGGKTKKTKKQENKELVTKNAMMVELLGQMGMTLDELNLADVEDYVDDDPTDEVTTNLRLGVQTMKERQREIDRYQSGRSRYCMFTFKAGGVGLSLHHTDEMTAKKCRRKKNNWVYPEDIPSVPTRPRVCFLAPTFSAIELVQGLGRCPRLTSLSHTKQVVVFYENTIEERVAAIVSQKLRCLRKVVRQKESWESVIIGGNGDNDSTPIISNQASLNYKNSTPVESTTTVVDDDEDGDVFSIGGDDDDE